MAHRRHGNFPQRRATLLPRVAKRGAGLQLAPEVMSSETGSNPTTTQEEPDLPAEHLCSTGCCEMKKESNKSCSRRNGAPSSEKQHCGKALTTLLKRISIHPEAQRVLGNSCVPVVSLERLNFQSLSFSSLQPVVSLVRLSIQTQTKLHHPHQTGFSQREADTLEVTEALFQPDPSQPEPAQTSWTEPFCPDSSTSEEPAEQDSGFDCDSIPDQPYILFDSGSDEWGPDGITDSETFYLDPDPEQNMVIQLDPEPDADQDGSLELEDDAETKWEVVQIDDSEDQRPGLCSSQDEVDSSLLNPGSGSQAEEMESEDFCAVCLNGGELLCCDRCPKVYHLSCHIPLLMSFPQGDWVCTLCRTDQEPVETYDCENKHSCGEVKAPYTLSNQDQRRCETLTLMLCCHTLSAPFHEPVSVLARNYYQIIKRPIDLSLIRRKLDKSNTLHYFTAEQFVDDVLLMFKNCATFNYPDSEVAQAGRSLELFFLSKLKEIFPDQTFPSASQERTDRVWLYRKRKENYRKRRIVFSGKKYYL